MNIQLLHYDLKQLYDALLTHPYLIDSPKMRNEFEDIYLSRSAKVCDLNTFLEAATALTC